MNSGDIELYKKQLKERIKSGMYAFIPNKSAVLKVGDVEHIAYSPVQGTKAEYGIFMGVVDVDNDPRYTIAETTVERITIDGDNEKAKSDAVKHFGNRYIACNGQYVYGYVDFARFDLKRFYKLEVESKGKDTHALALRTYIGKKGDYTLDECKSQKVEKDGKMKWVNPTKWSVEIYYVGSIDASVGDKALLANLRDVSDKLRTVLKDGLDELSMEAMRETVANLKEKAQKRTKAVVQTQHKITKQMIPSLNTMSQFIKPKDENKG